MFSEGGNSNFLTCFAHNMMDRCVFYCQKSRKNSKSHKIIIETQRRRRRQVDEEVDRYVKEEILMAFLRIYTLNVR